MPNWTFCKLEAPKEVLDKYIIMKLEEGAEHNPHLQFDFNRVIPQPEEYNDKDLISGGDEDFAIYWYLSDHGKISLGDLVSDSGKYFNFFSIPHLLTDEHRPETEEESERLYERGAKYIHMKDTYGYRDWYDWRNANWGTKWNACDTYYDNESIDELYIVEFDTAWCPPMPVIEKVFLDNPGCEIKFTWHDEDYNGHHVIIRDKDGYYSEDEYWVDECDPEYEDPE